MFSAHIDHLYSDNANLSFKVLESLYLDKTWLNLLLSAICLACSLADLMSFSLITKGSKPRFTLSLLESSMIFCSSCGTSTGEDTSSALLQPINKIHINANFLINSLSQL